MGVFRLVTFRPAPGRDVDFEVGGFVEAELFVDGGEGAEEQAGDVGESGGAARGDLSGGENKPDNGML